MLPHAGSGWLILRDLGAKVGAILGQLGATGDSEDVRLTTSRGLGVPREGREG